MCLLFALPLGREECKIITGNTIGERKVGVKCLFLRPDAAVDDGPIVFVSRTADIHSVANRPSERRRRSERAHVSRRHNTKFSLGGSDKAFLSSRSESERKAKKASELLSVGVSYNARTGSRHSPFSPSRPSGAFAVFVGSVDTPLSRGAQESAFN